jgi:probable F420-dependent oxidoreductase
MKLGIVALTTDQSVPIDVLAREIESRGLNSLYFGGDHTHVPVSRTSPFPGGGDPEMPEEYKRTYDPLIAATWAAAATSDIRLGTCVFLAAQRDAISTAKQVASVDRLSGGRFDFGVGYGWNVEEAASHGAAWGTRRALVRESVLAMKALWSEEEASYEGDFVTFEPSWMWPKPASSPRAILGAGPGPRTFAAITEWGDGWFPLPYWGHTPEHVATLRAYAADHGRDPAELAIIVDGVLPEPRYLDPWVEIDAESALVPVPSSGIDEVAPVLDAAAALLERYA